jgi:hypothetical protein
MASCARCPAGAAKPRCEAQSKANHEVLRKGAKRPHEPQRGPTARQRRGAQKNPPKNENT